MMKNKWLTIRVEEEMYNALRKKASDVGLDISNYIRMKLTKILKKKA